MRRAKKVNFVAAGQDIESECRFFVAFFVFVVLFIFYLFNYGLEYFILRKAVFRLNEIKISLKKDKTKKAFRLKKQKLRCTHALEINRSNHDIL